MAARDRSRDPNRVFKSNRVIDLTATRFMKHLTGKVKPVEASTSHKHEDEALEHNKPKLIAGPGWMGENKKDES